MQAWAETQLRNMLERAAELAIWNEVTDVIYLMLLLEKSKRQVAGAAHPADLRAAAPTLLE
jgi:hypothetical protein